MPINIYRDFDVIMVSHTSTCTILWYHTLLPALNYGITHCYLHYIMVSHTATYTILRYHTLLPALKYGTTQCYTMLPALYHGITGAVGGAVSLVELWSTGTVTVTGLAKAKRPSKAVAAGGGGGGVTTSLIFK